MGFELECAALFRRLTCGPGSSSLGCGPTFHCQNQTGIPSPHYQPTRSAQWMLLLLDLTLQFFIFHLVFCSQAPCLVSVIPGWLHLDYWRDHGPHRKVHFFRSRCLHAFQLFSDMFSSLLMHHIYADLHLIAIETDPVILRRISSCFINFMTFLCLVSSLSSSFLRLPINQSLSPMTFLNFYCYLFGFHFFLSVLVVEH